MIVLLILATLLLSILIGSISNLKVKYLYPIIIAITFVPSVFIYYNETALIHSLWYLAVSSFGLIIGMVIHKSVSYTHLDVYKRQSGRLPQNGHHKARPVSLVHSALSNPPTDADNPSAPGNTAFHPPGTDGYRDALA